MIPNTARVDLKFTPSFITHYFSHQGTEAPTSLPAGRESPSFNFTLVFKINSIEIIIP